MRELEPGGVDHVFDAIGGANTGPCISAARRGGNVVGYGFMGVSGKAASMAMFANLFVGSRLRGRRGTFYGITMLYKKDPQPFRDIDDDLRISVRSTRSSGHVSATHATGTRSSILRLSKARSLTNA